MTTPGCFITLEGVDGAGKSTHIAWMSDYLRQAGVDLVCTREPGGTPLGEQLRALLLQQEMDLRTETLLMFAARNEHWRNTIEPALQRGQWVLCDRYVDASYAYQGGGRALGATAIQALEQWLGLVRAPDRTFLFDVPLAVARQRLSRGRDAPDRFEQEGAAFFERTRDAYLARVRGTPGRFCVVDAQRGIDDVRQTLEVALDALLHAYPRPTDGSIPQGRG
ncbi:dTMP kinase [Castellaniella caeni]|uniref:dTMP kinase n=1 Tax=Castellaniella caeni TaxID=266123 RepID=UPI0008324CD6|nr:dTMP kinase [Castellaniella caeni]